MPRGGRQEKLRIRLDLKAPMQGHFPDILGLGVDLSLAGTQAYAYPPFVKPTSAQVKEIHQLNSKARAAMEMGEDRSRS